MGAGDAGMEDIWHWDEQGPRIAFKGPTGNTGDIPHVHARKEHYRLQSHVAHPKV